MARLNPSTTRTLALVLRPQACGMVNAGQKLPTGAIRASDGRASVLI